MKIEQWLNAAFSSLCFLNLSECDLGTLVLSELYKRASISTRQIVHPTRTQTTWQSAPSAQEGIRNTEDCIDSFIWLASGDQTMEDTRFSHINRRKHEIKMPDINGVSAAVAAIAFAVPNFLLE